MYNIYTVKYWRCSKYRIKKKFFTNNISIVLLHHSLSGKKHSKKKILLIIIAGPCNLPDPFNFDLYSIKKLCLNIKYYFQLNI